MNFSKSKQKNNGIIQGTFSVISGKSNPFNAHVTSSGRKMDLYQPKVNYANKTCTNNSAKSRSKSELRVKNKIEN